MAELNEVALNDMKISVRITWGDIFAAVANLIYSSLTSRFDNARRVISSDPMPTTVSYPQASINE